MIYLDHHAATPLDPAARDAMQAALAEQANPSSAHAPGRAARAAIEGARRALAQVLGAAPPDVVLTSGGTEACNLALTPARGDVILGALEHPAVVRAAERITRATGSSVIRLPARDPLSALPSAIERARSPLVAVQWVNHETGRVSPISELAAACRAAKVPLFVDATQALGKIPIDVSGIDLLAVSSAKVGGPLGAGALVVHRGIELDPLLVGSADERGRRAGSPALLSMIGFAAALRSIRSRLEAMGSIAAHRDALEAHLISLGAITNETEPRVATVTNVSHRAWKGELLVAALDVEGLAVSSGAACSSGLSEPSPVLLALHPDETWRASSALRVSLGPETTAADVDASKALLTRVFSR